MFKNLEQVHDRIKAACIRGGRKPEEVTLIAVSKTKPLEDLQEAYRCGERVFGENKVQEIALKQPQMPKDACFHMIGHLQRNKVRQVLPLVSMIHSVDSLRLAQEIQQEAKRLGRIVDILLEVNVAGEESKFGFAPEEVIHNLQMIREFSHIRVCGLMTIAPFVENSEQNRPVFKKLFQLYVDIKHKNIDNVNMSVLSMGMTGDYEVAVEEGATMIRVGTGIFGVR
ncbi:YggS family pyridoxal phosphate-dependent enzyme [bacterium D16-54]|nr:YggS family pyridoxal phosphate-dependent enzyme [bacterium D16-54]RKJ11212.1 YggS family pyridoxal phosphate-dependent enzyme [bacterium D16-56]